MKKLLSVVALGALILAGCTAAKDDPAPADSPATSETPAEQIADVDHLWVQDLWVYETVSMIDASGRTVDLTEQILADLEPREGEEHDLLKGASFTVYPDLKPSVTGADGLARADVDVVAGVLSADGARGLAVLGSPAPDAAAPIGLDDSVEFDLTFLDGLAPGDPLVVDFAFLQTVAGPAPGGLSQVELLQHRFEAGETQHYGDADGVGIYQGHLGQAVTGSTRAGMPAKADPLLDGLDEGASKCRGGNKCVSDLFDSIEGGAAGSMELINCNLGSDGCGEDPKPYVPPFVCIPIKGADCAGVSGDPHVVDLAGNRFDMQGVGEFVGLQGDDLEVQIRTAPWSDSRTISLLTGVAVRIDDSTLMINNPDEGLRALVDGDEIDLGEEGTQVDVGGAKLETFREAVQLTTSTGNTITMGGGSGDSLYLWVGADNKSELTGMLAGNAPDPHSVEAADGVYMPIDGAGSAFYRKFVASWRVTDDNSLFTYDAGQSTEDLTDLKFPDEVVTLKTLTQEQRARGLAVCTQAGIVSKRILADCVFDFAVTGSMDFVRDARFADLLDGVATGRIQIAPPGASSDSVSFSEASLSQHSGETDDAGQALVQLHYDDGDQLHAISLPGAETDWSAPMTVSGCGIAVADGDRVVAPLENDDGFAFQILDAKSGKVTNTVDTSFNYRQCADMTAVGNTAIAASSARESVLFGFDTETGEELFTEPVSDVVAGPFRSTEGSVWVITSIDKTLTAHEVDPATGKLGKSVNLPGTGLGSDRAVASTSDGFVVSVKGDDWTALVRVADGDIAWETKSPIEFDGREVGAPSAISADDQTVAGYSGSDTVVVLDLETGQPVGTIEPTSFNNNGGNLTHHGGNVVVGTFGGKAWVEAYDSQALDLAWDRDVPSGKEVNDAKRFASAGENGVMVLANETESGEEGVLVQFFKP